MNTYFGGDSAKGRRRCRDFFSFVAGKPAFRNHWTLFGTLTLKNRCAVDGQFDHLVRWLFPESHIQYAHFSIPESYNYFFLRPLRPLQRLAPWPLKPTMHIYGAFSFLPFRFIKDNRLVPRCVKHNPRISQRFIYLMKFKHSASTGRNSLANVVFPAPLGPAMM